MQFLVGLVRYWSFSLAAWAAGIGGVSYFLGYVDEVPAFFAANRTLMASALLLHFALCAIIYDATKSKRLAVEEIRNLGKAE